MDGLEYLIGSIMLYPPEIIIPMFTITVGIGIAWLILKYRVQKNER